jgi:hypothetical protein
MDILFPKDKMQITSPNPPGLNHIHKSEQLESWPKKRLSMKMNNLNGKIFSILHNIYDMALEPLSINPFKFHSKNPPKF